MAKMTLIEMTQDILSDMGDDEVNSISDTTEALQVASIIKSAFFEIIDGNNWPHLQKLLQLTPSSNNEMPTHMILPPSVKELLWLEYNRRKDASSRAEYQRIQFIDPDEFLMKTSRRDSTADNVREIEDPSGVALLIRDDKHPEYFTTFDDDYIVFDSYRNDLEATLQKVHTRCRAYVAPDWVMTDSFIPDLPSEMFSGLLAEAKSTAMLRLKDVADRKAEQQSERQLDWAKRKSWRVNGGIRLPNYGRRSRK